MSKTYNMIIHGFGRCMRLDIANLVGSRMLQGLPSQSGVVKAFSVAVNTFSGDVNPQLGTVIFIRAL